LPFALCVLLSAYWLLAGSAADGAISMPSRLLLPSAFCLLLSAYWLFGGSAALALGLAAGFGLGVQKSGATSLIASGGLLSSGTIR